MTQIQREIGRWSNIGRNINQVINNLFVIVTTTTYILKSNFVYALLAHVNYITNQEPAVLNVQQSVAHKAEVLHTKH